MAWKRVPLASWSRSQMYMYPFLLFAAARGGAVFGRPDPLPKAMLPDEIEKALKALGPDGAKVRGALERDFAAYTKQAAKDRTRLRTLLFVAVLRPIILRASKAAAEAVFSTDEEGFQARLAQVQSRIARREAGQAATSTVSGWNRLRICTLSPGKSFAIRSSPAAKDSHTR